MDDSKRSLEPGLRQALEGEARKVSTEHPEPEQLAAYHQGELDEVQEASMQEHLLWCRHCTALLLGFHDLSGDAELEATAAPSDPAPLADKSADSDAVAAGPPPAVQHPRGSSSSRWLPVLLAASLLLCAGLVFQTLRLQKAVDHLSEPQVDVAVQDLYLEDSLRAPAEDSGANGGTHPAAALSAKAEWITLILNAPDHPMPQSSSYEDHQLVIEDADGNEIWQRRGLAASPWNTFSVVLHRDFLEPGSYRLRVLGRQQDRWVEIGSFPLQVPAR